jgi:uncharacterized repeat protein (TIGR03837 family)
LRRNLSATKVDIFCRVVDNYGDIGITWRLARQLVSEYGLTVRLFVDDIASYEKIAVAANVKQDRVFPSIYAWKCPPNGEFDYSLVPADIVIEAFACELPAVYLSSMAARSVKPLWLNLEYLSAESWVAEHHLLPSPHPRLALTKYFFFPGFGENTGGLIREKTIQSAILNETLALNVFAFGYKSPRLGELIQHIADDTDVPRVTVPEGALADSLNKHAKIDIKPFVPQPDFDQLLATHDFLIVRGEDSFVRAQYAGKPFIWQIYPQEGDTHLIKLNAFLDRYCTGMSEALSLAVRELSLWLNGAVVVNPVAIESRQYWQNAVDQLAEWRPHAVSWQHSLIKQPDLATKLMAFYQKSLII